MPYKRFETEITIRPDDIDMNNHVHGSRYLDYVLHARFDQMDKCYGMPMEEFLKHGWNWFQKEFHIEYKRALGLGERAIVTTWLISFDKADVKVGFQIAKHPSKKISAEGHFVSTMVNMRTGRAEAVPDWIVERYAKFIE